MITKTLFLLLALLIGTVRLPFDGYAEDVAVIPVSVDEEITGMIDDADYATHSIMVRNYVDESRDAYQEEHFYVLAEAVIEKGGAVVSLRALVPGDEVTLRYRRTAEGQKNVEHIWVLDKKENL